MSTNKEEINALVLTEHLIDERRLSDDELNDVFTGWYRYDNHPVVICQESDGKLQKWDPSSHSICKELPIHSPGELWDALSWENVVYPIYLKKQDFMQKVNIGVLVGIFLAILLLGWMFFSSHMEAG